MAPRSPRVHDGSMSMLPVLALLVFAGTAALAGCDGDGGDADAGACPGALDAGTPFPVSIRLANKRAANVYLGQLMPGCASGPGFTLEDASGHKLNHSPDVCDRTCAELQLSSCACEADCAAPTVTLVAPGGHVDLPWAGWIFVDATMPAECYADPACVGPTCLVPVTPSRPLTVRATAHAEVAGCSGACIDCTPDASGSCIVPGATTVGGTAIEATGTWTNVQPSDAGAVAAEVDFE